MTDRPQPPPALSGRQVAVLVAGGIAAYKVADLVSLLVQGGCSVRVAMTEAATKFVGPVTFQGLSGNPVLIDLWDTTGAAEPHVELGDWAEVILLAPATANSLAKAAQGNADDIVTAVLLAARCPIVIAPAMNDAMWQNPAVLANVTLLRERAMVVVEPASGRLASGHMGTGRLPDAARLMDAMAGALASGADMAGRRVVVSAGGTREAIDLVRFIGNYSTGKMGSAMAEAAAARGARVQLVSTAPHPPVRGVAVRRVESATEMLAALADEVRGADLLVMAAAVADFRPEGVRAGKIRREEHGELALRLVPNVDILTSLADAPDTERLFRLGFAAEDSEVDSKAAEKLRRKNLDAIFANDISRGDIGFAADHNAGALYLRDGTRIDIGRSTKRKVADRILDAIVPRLSPAADQ